MTRETLSEHDRRLLHDYLDGELSEPDRTALETRLRTEIPLRREHEALSRTVEALSALPSEARPPRKLWPAIALRTGATSVRGGQVARVGVPRLAAAAAVLVAVSATATWLALRDGAPSGAGTSPDVATAPPAAAFADHPGARELLAEYEASAGALAQVLEAGGQVLSPETLAAVRRAMETVDRAIDEARSALAADPGSEELARILMANMKRRLDLLRNVAAVVQSAA